MKENATRNLAKFASDLQYDQLPLSVVFKTKEAIIDYIGATIAGYKVGSLLSEKLINLIINSGGKEEATIIGSGKKVPVVNAALANGLLSHVVELDDGHRIARGHPGVTVVSSAFAMAEYLNVSGKDLITAIVTGYDIFVRIASAINPSHIALGYHTTGTCGTFAAAATASKLLKLSSIETANAFGLAGIQAAGLLEVTIDGQMAKALHPGKSAQAGVLAALLAREGVEGPKSVIEGVKGFAKAMSEECDYDLMFNGLNEIFHINDCYIKPYPSCRHAHSPIDAVLSLITENKFEIDDIIEILIRTYPTAISFTGEIFKPESAEAAKFSMAYGVSAALVNKKFGLKELEIKQIFNPTIRKLTEKVKIESDASLESLQPKTRGAEVLITLKDGRKLFKRINLPKGEIENPIIFAELMDKFNYCMEDCFSEIKRDKIIQDIEKLENIEGVRCFISQLQSDIEMSDN